MKHDQETASVGTALVMAGGGALGAYEAGALRYVLDELATAADVAPQFDIFSGTSVGAINAAFLAAQAHQPVDAVRALGRYWADLTLEKVLRFRNREMAATLQMLLGAVPGRMLRRRRLRLQGPHPPVAGLFDTTPLNDDVSRRVDWEQLQKNLANGTVQGVAFCATEVCTGSSVIFYQTSGSCDYRAGRDPWKTARPVRLTADHAMASAAIPFLFPAVQVGGVCFTDGALRQNTPLNPALRMGADRALVISLTQDPLVASHIARIGCRKNAYPGVLFLLGKTVNVLLSESLDCELNRVELYNKLIVGGQAVYGDGFLTTLNDIMGGQRNAAYRLVKTCHLRPSRNLHSLAIEAAREAPAEVRLPGLSGIAVSRLLRSSVFADSELFAYLMFTPTFIGRLLELGFDDAKQHREQLLRFFD